MPVRNQTEYRSTTRGVRAIAYQALKETPVIGWLDRLFWIIQSNTPEEIIHFLRGVPKMREWVGERKIRSMAMASFKISKKDWEATVAVERDDILYDRLGLIKPNIQAMGQSYPRHMIDLLVTILIAGFTQPAYDGQYYFDVDHDRGDGVSMSNKSTAVFSEAAWETARSAPALLTDPDSEAGAGDYLEVEYDFMLYGQKAEARQKKVFDQEFRDDLTPNPWFNQIPPANRVKLKQLGDSEKWFLFDTSSPIKPLILQIIQGPNFVAKDDIDSDEMFYRRQAVYGIDSIDSAQFALWEMAYGSTGGEVV